MAITTSEHKGIVVGHTAKIFAEKRETHEYRGRVRSSVLESYLTAYLQVWVDEKLAFVQCPLDVANIVLYNHRNATLDEIKEVLRVASGTYPLGTELDLIHQEITSYNGKKFKVYVVKRDRPPVNSSRKKNKKPNRQMPAEQVATPEEEPQIETPTS